MPFESEFTGGSRVFMADVTGNGIPDAIVAAGEGGHRVVIYDGVTFTEIASFQPFEDGFFGGAYVTAGDMNGDGMAEIIVTAGQGGSARVRVFDGAAILNNQQVVIADFIGLASLNGEVDDMFRGGTRAVVGDFNGDGNLDLAVVAGNGGSPRVTVWDGVGILNANGGVPSMNPMANLFVFNTEEFTGLFVGAGDINGNGVADLIFGAGNGGGPRVRIVDAFSLIGTPNGFNLDDPGRESLTIASFFVGDPDNASGIRVVSRDLNNDGIADVVAGSGIMQPSQATIFNGSTINANPGDPAIQQLLDPFEATIDDGIYVG